MYTHSHIYHIYLYGLSRWKSMFFPWPTLAPGLGRNSSLLLSRNGNSGTQAGFTHNILPRTDGLLLSGGGERPASPCGLHGHQRDRDGSLLHYCPVGMKVPVPHSTFSNTSTQWWGHWGHHLYPGKGGNLGFSTWHLLLGWGWGCCSMCGAWLEWDCC